MIFIFDHICQVQYIYSFKFSVRLCDKLHPNSRNIKYKIILISAIYLHVVIKIKITSKHRRAYTLQFIFANVYNADGKAQG